MTLILSGDITLRRTWQPMDPDAAAYITAVETADGQALEEPVKIAIDNFVLGCKSDGVWDAIKASCILAGARTLDGALVPLAGTAPTNFNFVAGDYNRKTGLVGDGSTKYLNSNRNNNADPRDNKHLSVYQSSTATNNSLLIACTNVAGRSALVSFVAGGISSRINNFTNTSNVGNGIGFAGGSRATSAGIIARVNGQNYPQTVSSETPANLPIGVFANHVGAAPTDARIAFYSIGESLDLALLDARVTDLINKFAEVIP